MHKTTPLKFEKKIANDFLSFSVPQAGFSLKTEYSAAKHELAAPLAGIRTCALSLLREDLGTLSESQKEFLNYIKEYSESLDRTLRQYLEYLHLETILSPKNFTEIEMGNLLKRKLDFFLSEAQGRDVQLLVEISDKAFPVLGDAEKISRAFDYLIQFVLENTSRKSSAQLEVTSEHSQIEISLYSYQCRIPEEDLAHLFKPFFPFSGISYRGVSLALAQKIFALHQGVLRVQGFPGQGILFQIVLPAFNNQ